MLQFSPLVYKVAVSTKFCYTYLFKTRKCAYVYFCESVFRQPLLHYFYNLWRQTSSTLILRHVLVRFPNMKERRIFCCRNFSVGRLPAVKSIHKSRSVMGRYTLINSRVQTDCQSDVQCKRVWSQYSRQDRTIPVFRRVDGTSSGT